MLGIIHRLSTELSASLPSTQERFDFQPLFSRWRKQFLKIKRNVNPGQENNLSFFNRVSSFQESPERSEYRHNFKNFNQTRTHDAINESWRRWRSILRGSLHEYNRAKSEYNLWCMKKKWMQFFFASFEEQQGTKCQMFWDELSVSNVYLLLGSFIWVTCWELKFRSRVRVNKTCSAVLNLSLSWLFYYLYISALLFQWDSLCCKRAGPSLAPLFRAQSVRQSLKFHRKQFGGWVIWKVRWVHMSALYLCLWLWVSVLFMSGERRCLLSQGWFLADDHRGVKPHFIWRVFWQEAAVSKIKKRARKPFELKKEVEVVIFLLMLRP